MQRKCNPFPFLETDETIAKLGDHIKETEGLLESLKEENEEYVKFTTLEAKKLALQHFLALRDRQRIEDKLKEVKRSNPLYSLTEKGGKTN